MVPFSRSIPFKDIVGEGSASPDVVNPASLSVKACPSQLPVPPPEPKVIAVVSVVAAVAQHAVAASASSVVVVRFIMICICIMGGCDTCKECGVAVSHFIRQFACQHQNIAGGPVFEPILRAQKTGLSSALMARPHLTLDLGHRFSHFHFRNE